MHSGMACRTKCNQILLRIVAGLAAEFFVMDFKIGHCATRLASPAVAMQHLVAQIVVLAGIEPQAVHVSVGPESQRLLGHMVQKRLPLFPGEELEKP